MISKKHILLSLFLSNISLCGFSAEVKLTLVQSVESAESWAGLPSLEGKPVSVRLQEASRSQALTLYLLGGKKGDSVSSALSKIPKKFSAAIVFDANLGKMVEITVPSTDSRNQPRFKFKLESIKNDSFTADITFIPILGEEGHTVKIEEHWKNFEFFFAVYLGAGSSPIRLDQFLLFCFKVQ